MNRPRKEYIAIYQIKGKENAILIFQKCHITDMHQNTKFPFFHLLIWCQWNKP